MVMVIGMYWLNLVSHIKMQTFITHMILSWFIYTYVYIMIVGEVLSIVSNKILRDPRLAVPFDGFASSILREYLAQQTCSDLRQQ
jgi:hypothetical protein